MNRKFPSPAAVLALVAFALILLPAESASALSKKKTAKPAAAAKSGKADKRARADKGRERGAAKSAKKETARKAADRKSTAKETRAERRARERAERRERAAAKNDRRGSKREQRDDRRASKNDRRDRRDSARADEKKDSRRMSKRERLEARREAERRRREEAARRAEAARQAAIARAIALARIRAADQALRDEAAANILKDDPTGEDLEVRRAAMEAVAGQAATVVVMDPKDGRVYTAVNQDWALRRGFKPCSTIKLVTGLAGLSTNVINPVQTVQIGAGSFSLDLTESLAVSNNTYFQKVGGAVGFNHMMETARKLGLGQPTGVNHLYESPGRLPVFKEGWSVNHMSSHGDDIEVTPIQLATMASAIANGGTLLRPHLPRTPQENVRFKREVRAKLDIPQEHLQRVIPGMVGAVSYGTGRRAYDPTQTVAGKTGSCIGQGTWLGLFTSFAPVHDPRLAVAVVTRGSRARGKYAAHIAGEIYRKLNHRFGTRPGSAPALANDKLLPPPIDPRKAAILNEEEAEAEQQQHDAFVLGDSATDASGAQQQNLQRTAKTGATQPSGSGGGTARPAVRTPAPAPTVQPTPVGRPRRVNP